jgi:DNA polymerase-3 subunit delta
MIVALLGNNEAAIRRRLQELRDLADGGTGMLESNLARFDASVSPDEVIAAAATVPFLASHRLVIVEGLIDRFEGGRSEGRGGKALDAWEPLFRWLEHDRPPTSILVFTGQGEARRNPFLERLRSLPGASVETFPALKGDQLLRFVREEAAARGIRFAFGPSRRPLLPDEEWRRPKETDPALLLATVTQGDSLSILNELDKLALYAMGRDVTVDDVDLLCGSGRAVTVWEFIDAVMDGDLAAAGRALRVLLRTGESEQGIFALLASGYRSLVTVLDLLDEGADEEAVGKAINRPYPRLRQAFIRRARELGREGVAAAYEAIVDADRSLKLGEVDPDLALELLVIRLCGLRRARVTGAARRA